MSLSIIENTNKMTVIQLNDTEAILCNASIHIDI